jgi:protein-S-isoprenylcysteine O-methyltransferase Ste14
VGLLIPLWVVQPQARFRLFRPAAWMLVISGVLLLLWCVREFYVAGKGTLAPWSPPRHLVTTGPYRFSRNPMYVAVPLILWGWAAGFQSPALAVYAAAVMIGFYLRVILSEEPWAARTFPSEWIRYRGMVRRWL